MRRVTCSSARDGLASPDGWLCISTKAWAAARITGRRISRGWAELSLTVPSDTRCQAKGRKRELSITTQTLSLSGSKSGWAAMTDSRNPAVFRSVPEGVGAEIILADNGGDDALGGAGADAGSVGEGGHGVMG